MLYLKHLFSYYITRNMICQVAFTIYKHKIMCYNRFIDTKAPEKSNPLNPPIVMSASPDRKEYRMEAVITASPHAFDPIAYRSLSENERGKIFRKRVNELVKPYTVVDVLTEVYHRSFANDLSDYIGSHTEEFARFKKSDD